MSNSQSTEFHITLRSRVAADSLLNKISNKGADDASASAKSSSVDSVHGDVRSIQIIIDDGLKKTANAKSATTADDMYRTPIRKTRRECCICGEMISATDSQFVPYTCHWGGIYTDEKCHCCKHFVCKNCWWTRDIEGANDGPFCNESRNNDDCPGCLKTSSDK